MPPKTAAQPTRRTTNAPRNINQLASMPMQRRSDLAAWCTGFDTICEQLALLAEGLADELYLNLIAKHGNSFDARSRARRATRPLRALASSARMVGKLAPRAYRKYAVTYADEISPAGSNGARRRTFDHRN